MSLRPRIRYRNKGGGAKDTRQPKEGNARATAGDAAAQGRGKYLTVSGSLKSRVADAGPEEAYGEALCFCVFVRRRVDNLFPLEPVRKS